MGKFGKRLKKARNERGLSQSELAEQMGVTQASISQLETGKRQPTPALIGKAAQVLNVDREYLTGKSESDLEREILWRNVQGMSSDSLEKINDFVDYIKHKEKRGKN